MKEKRKALVLDENSKIGRGITVLALIMMIINFGWLIYERIYYPIRNYKKFNFTLREALEQVGYIDKLTLCGTVVISFVGFMLFASIVSKRNNMYYTLLCGVLMVYYTARYVVINTKAVFAIIDMSNLDNIAIFRLCRIASDWLLIIAIIVFMIMVLTGINSKVVLYAINIVSYATYTAYVIGLIMYNNSGSVAMIGWLIAYFAVIVKLLSLTILAMNMEQEAIPSDKVFDDLVATEEERIRMENESDTEIESDEPEDAKAEEVEEAEESEEAEEDEEETEESEEAEEDEEEAKDSKEDNK